MADILNFWLTASITYYNLLHGFQASNGTGTATLEAKLIHQLAAMREEVLYVIFLDLHKVYNALDRYRYLEIMLDPSDVLGSAVSRERGDTTGQNYRACGG